MKTWCVLSTVALLVSSPVARGAATDLNLDPQQPYQAERTNAVIYDGDFSAVVTPPYKCKVLKVWLPLPQSDFGQEVTEGELSTFPIKIEPAVSDEKMFGNRFAYFEFAEPQGAQIVRHSFKIKVWELRWNLDPAKVVSVSKWPAAFDGYRQGDQQSVVVDDRFRELANRILPKRGNPLSDLTTVMTWANENFQYDHADASLRASAVHALEKQHGHCSDYHGFCASMGRVLGLPTRVTYGLNTFAKNSPSHCKLEAYLPPYGWVSFDVSETQRMVAEIGKDNKLDSAKKKELTAAADQRLVRGFRDNTWFLQTRGTDYDLAPPASKKVPVVRTIYAEADGVALPDPDPANPAKREFAWMTVHQFTPDRPVTYPFKDVGTLKSVDAPSSNKSSDKQ